MHARSLAHPHVLGRSRSSDGDDDGDGDGNGDGDGEGEEWSRSARPPAVVGIELHAVPLE